MTSIRATFNKTFAALMNWLSNMDLARFSLLSLILVIINFFPLITRLGFYLDDWPQIYSWNVHGMAGIKQYWIADSRALAWWIEGILFPIFGTKPILWHVCLALLRWVTAILFWIIFTNIWPKQKKLIVFAALLFSVYPLFSQQSSGLMFTVIWVCFTLYLLSLYLMVKAWQNRKWFIPLTLLGMIFDLANLLTCEYFLGLEFLRPFIFYLLISREELPIKKKIGRSLLFSIPWLVMALAYLVWRAFLIQTPTLRSPVIFTNLLNQPLQTLIQLLESVIKDFIQVVISVWYGTLEPALFDITLPSDMFAWLLAGMTFLLFFLVLGWTEKKDATRPESQPGWVWQALAIGFLTIILGAAPSWAIGRSITDETGIWNDRFGIASMPGASLFLVALVTALVKPTRKRVILVLTFMIALATASNFRFANEYRWSATHQSRFFNQLVWRAPSITPDTAIISGNELFTKMGVYPTAFAINTLYPASRPIPQVDYWFYVIPHYFPTNYFNLDEGFEIEQEKWYVKFNSLSTNSLVIYWNPNEPSCLWMLDENDRYNPFIADYIKETLGASNLARINQQESPGYPPEDIFGPEAAHGWCYYFEKADLAKQYQNWDEVIALYDETNALGFNTNFGPELTPFIHAYALSGDLEKAVALTNTAKTMAEKMNPYLCDQWQAIYELSDRSPQMEDTFETLKTELSCGI